MHKTCTRSNQTKYPSGGGYGHKVLLSEVLLVINGWWKKESEGFLFSGIFHISLKGEICSSGYTYTQKYITVSNWTGCIYIIIIIITNDNIELGDKEWDIFEEV